MTIRTGWQMFQRLDTTVADADAAAPDGSCQGVSSHARAGLSFGVGTFNLVISALPPALVRIVSSLGFPSSRRVGIERLRHCFGHRGIRAPLAGMGLLSHHVFIPSFSSVDNRRHCAAANAIIDELFRRYPEVCGPFQLLLPRPPRPRSDSTTLSPPQSGVLRIINGRVLRHQRKLGPAVDSFRAGLDPTVRLLPSPSLPMCSPPSRPARLDRAPPPGRLRARRLSGHARPLAGGGEPL